jgi:hypothetical protein
MYTLLDARMPAQPGPGGEAVMARQAVGDHREGTGRVHLFQPRQKRCQCGLLR